MEHVRVLSPKHLPEVPPITFTVAWLAAARVFVFPMWAWILLWVYLCITWFSFLARTVTTKWCSPVYKEEMLEAYKDMEVFHLVKNRPPN